MDTLEQYLETIPNDNHRAKLRQLIEWTASNFEELNLEIKWNQPMLVHNGTFIIAFSAAKHYLTIAPETAILHEFLERITATGYQHTKMKFQIKWNQEIDYELLHALVARSIEFKRDSTTFWA